jgi:hypothetical protein
MKLFQYIRQIASSSGEFYGRINWLICVEMFDAERPEIRIKKNTNNVFI